MVESSEEKRKRLIGSAKEAVTAAYSTGEHSIAQAINAYNEIEKSKNLIHERLSEWYGLYFPELSAGESAYAAFVIEFGSEKKKLTKTDAERLFGEKASYVMHSLEDSMGREPSKEDYDALLSMAKAEVGLDELQRRIDMFLKDGVPKIMPNISYLIEYRIAAELLSRAGSLQRLASMPASTLQLLGAEKALFRHLRTGARSPKYGVLFKLNAVANAKREDKGRVARVYATKISIAARADAFSKRFIAKELKQALDKALSHAPKRPESAERMSS